LLFPQPGALLPSLRAAGLDPGLDQLARAHYRAMSLIDVPGTPEPTAAQWWQSYLIDFVTECGVAEGERAAMVAEMVRTIPGFGWTYVGPQVADGLRAIGALGVKVGIVSNSDGSVQSELRRLGVCWAGAPACADGVEVGVVIDSAVVGVAKPDPRIFSFALDALGVAASRDVLHVGDSLRYDVTGALAAGLRPVHLDPYGFCPAPEGHEHIRSLLDVPALAALHRCHY
jgi:putative hydrolase of the HAD superfamily